MVKDFVKKISILGIFVLILLFLSTISLATEAIATTKYMIKDNVIMRIDSNTNVSQFLSNIQVNSGAPKAVYSGQAQLGDDAKLGTGMILKVGTDTIYNIAVRGDANGDAKVTATDLSLFKMHSTNLKLLEGIYLKGVDINCDLKVSMVDLSLLKMILVGLSLPEDELPNINGDITILPNTTNYAKELTINVYWPEDTTGLAKQVSIDKGKTYQNYTGSVTMKSNSTVIARLVDENSRVVKSASLVITNIDSEGPANFDLNVEHKITNYTVLSGETTDNVSGLAGYYFSYDDGNNWSPKTGQLSGKYVFTNVPANTTVNLKMKAMDKVGNQTLTSSIVKRTFKNGITILKERLTDVTVDTTKETITLPDGRIFRLAITEEGGYAIRSLGTETDSEAQLAEENTLNEKIATYEINGSLSNDEILTKLTEENLGTGTLEDGVFTTENTKGYVQYLLKTNISDKHQLVFLKTISKAGLTASGQIKENETLIAIEDLIALKRQTVPNVGVIEILDQVVEDGLLLEENVNRNNGKFETEVGLVYQINPENDYAVELVGLAEDVENGYIAGKLLSVLEEGLKDQIIDWAIADGVTTENKTSRKNGIYQTNNGAYKEVIIDMEKGNYDTTQIDKPEGAIIEYTLTPNFPTMTNKTVLGVTAKGDAAITKIEVFTELGQTLLTKSYTDNLLTKSESVDVTYNGSYFVKVTTSDNKVSEKEILVGNIASILPIKVTINPETARNTVKTEIQNGVATGPISVTLKFSEAPLLDNANKYQYQLYTTDGDWLTASKEQLIQNITTNCKIYARYFDGEKSIKQIEIVIDTVDNVAPNAFSYTTIVNSNSITVKASTEDTATDSSGTVSREGVEGISQYLYSIDGGEWQQDNVFSNLTQLTNHTISAKAIDHAGNETNATNNGSNVSTTAVPAADSVISFEYSDTELTNQNVVVKIKSSLLDETYMIQYQPISGVGTPIVENWITGDEYEATGNCKIYVRLVDSTGQENSGKNYAVGTIANIDNAAPTAFKPKAIATTKNSIKINASSENNGEAIDAPVSDTTLSSGTVKYDYYITSTLGVTTKVENQTGYVYEFTNLKQGDLYSIYVIATDRAGNSTVSESITVVTNGTLNEYTNAHTTITGLIEDATYNNPIIPVGFAPVNESGAEWGDGTATPENWNDGLVIRDRDGNEFVWVPVDGTDVTYQKWLTSGISYTNVTDGENVLVNGEELTENAQIEKYKGFYISRTEAAKNGIKPSTKKGETPWGGNNYLNAKEKAESMYNSNLLQSALVTGTQWDTLMKWLDNKEENLLEATANGNFTGSRKSTASSETYKINNIYDLSGNMQEITNEFNGQQVIVRGGAYDVNKNMSERYSYSQEYANEHLGFRTVLYVIETDELEPTGEGALGIGNINKGPGNITINNGTPSYLNPVVPAGFKAINTPDAKWFGLPTPKDWNKGLVIEDEGGNQFVWVPVDGNKIKYEKWYTIFAPSTIKSEDIDGDSLPNALEQLSVTEKQQIDTYGGFYVARYEAGMSEGLLASKAGSKAVNAVTFEEAKEYAESMYGNPYVKSGLLTGTAWDTTTKWMASNYTENRVLNDKTSGNNATSSFKFSGEYAVGPNSTTEVRGEYQMGTNITKTAGTRMLLATGLVEAFKTNNIYDMAGNVWEYTYEYTINDKNEKEYIARGADYYRKYSVSAKWGAAIRENVSQKVAERRNEGGFRVMLYLVEGGATLGKYEDFNRTMNGKPSTYDNPIIPAGFAPVNKGANWGNGTTIVPEWNKGLVIDDEAGNEFVWVPVDKTNVLYQKWLNTGLSYKETDGDEIPNKVGTWGEEETTQIYKYGGFYISRYEASKLSTETGVTGASIANTEAWTNIDYITAKQMAESMQTKDTVTAGLVTGTAWDTTMRWIANEKGSSSYVAEDSTTWGYYSNSSLGKDARIKNIYLLAGGNWEWTSEKVKSNYAYRGGVRTDRGDSSPAGYRGAKVGTTLDEATTFRMMLFVTGDVLGAATKPVSESEALNGTKLPSSSNEPILASGMTAVKWNGTNWISTVTDDPDWYAYQDTTLEGINTSKWANAKTPDGSMWVWIPRYAYKVVEDTNAHPKNGSIEILFLEGTTNESLELTSENIYAKASGTITSKTNFIVHPAFRSDVTIGGWDEELSGIWVGKFETSGDSKENIGSRPGVASFGYDGQGSGQFNLAMNATLGLSASQKSQIDSHMAKNSEWGAVAYLAHSKYGVDTATVEANPTGIAGNDYETNVKQSTTGNIYGVYDMAGGRMEYMSSYMGSWAPARFGNIANIVRANLKYKQIYGAGYNYYGDALGETAGWQGSSYKSPDSYMWDHGSPRPLYVRGAAMSGGASTIFSTSVQCSNTNYAYSFRIIIVNN